MTIDRRGFVLAGLSTFAGSTVAAREVPCFTIFAASSLALVVDPLTASFSAHQDCTPVISYAASSTLARQIAAGAPADLFLSADEEWIIWLRREAGLSSEPVVFAGNTLVIALPPDRVLSPDELRAAMKKGRIATGDPDHVPLGRYVQSALEREGRWNDVAANILPFESAGAATRAVSQGLADVGILYETDALSAGLSIVGRLADPVPPIAYYALALRASPDTEAFLAHLTGPETSSILKKFGFRPAPPGRV